MGPSPQDPSSLPHPGHSFVVRLAEPLPQGLRFGVSKDLGYAVLQPDVASAFEEAVQVFEQIGHRLVPIEDGPPDMSAEWGQQGAFEAPGSCTS